MRMVLRFAMPLLLVLLVIALAMTPVVDGLMARWFRSDVETRAQLVFRSIQDSVATLLAKGDERGLDVLFRRIAQDERLLALGLCSPAGVLTHQSHGWPKALGCPPDASGHVFRVESAVGEPVLEAAFPLSVGNPGSERLVILHDLGFIDRRNSSFDLYLAGVLGLFGLAAAGVTVLAVKITLRGWLRSVRRSLDVPRIQANDTAVAPEIAPLVRYLRQMLHDADMAAAGGDAFRIDWNADVLRQVLNNELPKAEVIVVSNREPYIHNREGDAVVLQRPASGLVSALEPIMRACGGTWIAHGSGSADREVVDAADHLAVPPDAPEYTLRRLWLTEEEQDGYYYGLANEGLWPLCHIAFVRPVFRASDWAQYEAVNRKFAEALVSEVKTRNPLVLIQDYHFALLPRMIRERLPDATIVTFWHIPWPNAEVFSICPWRKEILDGLLGSSILGFHTQFHCNNFIESVDRFLESRIDREHGTIGAGGNATLIRPYPISIEWPPAGLVRQAPVEECRQTVRRRHNLAPDLLLAVGVERFDYTKGITDRFRAVESLFDHHPDWIGRFSLLQVAAPSRGRLAAYRDYQAEALATAERVNRKFGREGWVPIVLVARHHELDEVLELFRAADVGVVTSLHDGMNLVAKEFVAARDDERGVLVLSTFAGASRELLEALIVNPYDAAAMGEALHQALTMPPDRQRERMAMMRESVSENNIYAWAGRMLLDAARMRKRARIEERIVRSVAQVEVRRE